MGNGASRPYFQRGGRCPWTRAVFELAPNAGIGYRRSPSRKRVFSTLFSVRQEMRQVPQSGKLSRERALQVDFPVHSRVHKKTLVWRSWLLLAALFSSWLPTLVYCPATEFSFCIAVFELAPNAGILSWKCARCPKVENSVASEPSKSTSQCIAVCTKSQCAARSSRDLSAQPGAARSPPGGSQPACVHNH